MTTESIKELSILIYEENFFEVVAKAVKDWDEALDQRDRGEFDASWVESNECLKKLDYQIPTDEMEISALREFSFKKVFRLTQNSEAASYVSDDIGMIGEAIAKGHVSEWVARLLDLYRKGEFPC